jgi:hypothetical protein
MVEVCPLFEGQISIGRCVTAISTWTVCICVLVLGALSSQSNHVYVMGYANVMSTTMPGSESGTIVCYSSERDSFLTLPLSRRIRCIGNFDGAG